MSTFREEGDEALDNLLKPLDGEAGPARRVSKQKSVALVGAALAAVAIEETVTSQRRLGKPKRPPMWLMAGALVLTGAAAAAVWRYARSEPVAAAREVEGAVARPAPAGDGFAAEGMRPSEPGRGDAPSVLVSPVSMPRDATAEEAPASEALPEQGSEVSPGAARPPARTPRRNASAQSLSAAAPEDLLRMANELRAGGRWKEAEALYLRVIRAEPSSLASYVARVASGSLRLEHLGNPRGALRHFQDALRLQPQGVLGQEARHGIAEAYRALGDTVAEARALETFLASHPDSPLGKTARARLRELSAP
ncbi:tetratricopeptide repeat protein [Pyxidicoccus xibeiensis]|uniref:tetratricopeptide repeat protein n=1 Tax=Pyxidicoccus xibeiensis TaxID=2906759 RepID=UPI0020A7635F|nr:tetratricopeptide repeat protein [Pyxidicoccus xibeiensis]MCP3142579.1 tetratricopeptide repeat protein [Pyxidicoccus xibeiensis]